MLKHDPERVYHNNTIFVTIQKHPIFVHFGLLE